MVDFWFVVNLLVFLLIAIWIRRRIRHQPLARYFLPGLTVKIVAGITFGLVYFGFYQGGDTVSYHENAVYMADLARSDPESYLSLFFLNDPELEIWQKLQFQDEPRALLMVKVLSLVYLLVNNNYWLAGFYFSLFSAYSMWSLANRFALFFPWSRVGAIIGFLFFPSVIFWTAGVSKETLSTGLICWILSLYMPMLATGKIIERTRFFWSVALFIALLALKYYLAAALFALLVPTLVVCGIKGFSIGISWNFGKQVLYWLSFLVWSALLATFFHPNLRLDTVLGAVRSNNESFLEISEPQELVSSEKLETGVVGFLKRAPESLFAGLFSPQPWHAHNLAQKIVGFENLLLLILTIVSLLNLGRINRSNHGVLVIALITYVVLSSVFIASATPNIGTLARYRVGYQPFLIFLILADSPFRRILKRFAATSSHEKKDTILT